MEFLPSSGCVNTTLHMEHMDADKTYREKVSRELHKNATSYIEQILEVTSHKKAAVKPPSFHLKNHPNQTNKTCWTLLEKQGQTHK